jgi:exonuclease SbcD
VVIVDLVPGGPAKVQPIYLNCGKALKRWRANSIEEARLWCVEPKNHSCWVDLEIMADQSIGISELTELRKIHPGIITIRPVFPELAGENREARRLSEMPLVERFGLFFQRERGIAPPEDMIRFFLEMVNQSESDSDSPPEDTSQPTGGEVA